MKARIKETTESLSITFLLSNYKNFRFLDEITYENVLRLAHDDPLESKIMNINADEQVVFSLIVFSSFHLSLSHPLTIDKEKHAH